MRGVQRPPRPKNKKKTVAISKILMAPAPLGPPRKKKLGPMSPRPTGRPKIKAVSKILMAPKPSGPPRKKGQCHQVS